jgi:hypothetical protein
MSNPNDDTRFDVAHTDEEVYDTLDQYLNKIMDYIKGTEERHIAVVFAAMAVDEKGEPVSVVCEMGGDDACVRALFVGAMERYEVARLKALAVDRG